MTPFEQFRQWIVDVAEPVSMALATASADGAPSVRMVLLKGADEDGFVFFTNYESRKGRELAENPHAALLVHVPGRQIRVEGDVERLPSDDSDRTGKHVRCARAPARSHHVRVTCSTRGSISSAQWRQSSRWALRPGPRTGVGSG